MGRHKREDEFEDYEAFYEEEADLSGSDEELDDEADSADDTSG